MVGYVRKHKLQLSPLTDCSLGLLLNLRPIYIQLEARTKQDAARPAHPDKKTGKKNCVHNRKPTELLQLIFVSVTVWYHQISLLTSSISALLLTSMIMSSTYAEYLAKAIAPGNMIRPQKRWSITSNAMD